MSSKMMSARHARLLLPVALGLNLGVSSLLCRERVSAAEFPPFGTSIVQPTKIQDDRFGFALTVPATIGFTVNKFFLTPTLVDFFVASNDDANLYADFSCAVYADSFSTGISGDSRTIGEALDGVYKKSLNSNFLTFLGTSDKALGGVPAGRCAVKHTEGIITGYIFCAFKGRYYVVRIQTFSDYQSNILSVQTEAILDSWQWL